MCLEWPPVMEELVICLDESGLGHYQDIEDIYYFLLLQILSCSEVQRCLCVCLSTSPVQAGWLLHNSS